MFQLVLELQSDGTVVTSDDPPVVLGTLPSDFIEQVLSFPLYFSSTLSVMCVQSTDYQICSFDNLLWFLKNIQLIICLPL